MASVSPATIYSELLSLGASTNQAIGIMANMINESGFNPEAVGDQGTSFGLVQQHGAYGYLVTGNPVADMKAQLKLLVQNGGLGAAGGGSAQSAAGNFAANYEKCVGCQPGGAQYNSRVGNVGNLLNALATGKWPTSGGSGGGGGGGGGSGGGGGGGGGGGTSPGIYSAFFSSYPGQIETTSFLGDIFSTIEDPFKAVGDAVDQLSKIFASPFISFLDVFKVFTTAFSSIVNGFDTIIKDVLWLFNPTHWVRIFCFVFGLFVTIPAIYALMHTGTGDMYLAMGIALTTLAGILFFLAFHNLPYQGPDQPASAHNVITFQSLLAWVSEGIRTGVAPGTSAPTPAHLDVATTPANTGAASGGGGGFSSDSGSSGNPSGSGGTFTPIGNATGLFPTLTPGGIIPAGGALPGGTTGPIPGRTYPTGF